MGFNVRDPQAEHPVSAGTSRSRRHRHQWIRWAGTQVLSSDVVRVTLMAVAITLSSFTVYQGTRAADEAGERLDELRVAQAADMRWASYLSTVVDHDARTMVLFCQATAEREGVMAELLRDKKPNTPLIVSSMLRARALRSMVLGDPLARCPPSDGGQSPTQTYEVARAQQLLLGSFGINAAFSGRAASGGLADEVARLGTAEQNLMAAGLFFAISLLCLIFIEVSGQRRNRPAWMRGPWVGRWRRLALLFAAVCSLTGLVILVAYRIDLVPTLLLLGAVAGAVACVPVWLRWRGRRGVTPSTEAHPHWWAEGLGGVAIVAFSLAAFGLSAAAIQHREVVAHADALQSESHKLQQVAEQDALRDLASMSLMAELEAEQSAASNAKVRDGEAYSAEFDRLKELEGSLDQQQKDIEESVRNQTHVTSAGECADLTGTSAASAGDLFYDELGSGAAPVLDTSILRWHLLERQQSAIACDVATTLTRSTARVWAGHTSTFTVALVVIGLAGFMLALGADVDRSRRSSRVLLAIGSGGTVVGLLLSSSVLPDLVRSNDTAPSGTIQEVARAISSSYADSCVEDSRAALDHAIDLRPDYGPAYSARARARYCGISTYGDGYVSSEVQVEVLPDVIADLKKAVELGPPSPQTSMSLGWALISHGIAKARKVEVVEGLVRTNEAVATLERADDSSGTLLPVARLNVALGLAALDNHDAALRAYDRALVCLPSGSTCPGRGLDDPAQVDDVILAGLADLELIADRVDVEPYRRALMGRERTMNKVDPAALELTIFDQELQISGAHGAPVVWYYRGSPAHTWAVINAPSRVTAHANWDGPLVNAGRLLEAGDYRADVYIDGRRTELDEKDVSVDNLSRLFSRRLGLSVAAPSAWKTQYDDGVEWHLGPGEQEGLTLRRIEGIPPMHGADTEPYLRKQLAEWLKEQSGGKSLTSTLEPDEHWFLGYADTLMAQVPGLLVAAHLEPYGNRSLCGGTLFLAAITGDATKALDVVEDVALEQPQHPPTDRPVSLKPDDYFAVTLPARWGALRDDEEDSDALSGGSCENGAYFTANWPKLQGTLDGAVDADVRDLSQRGTEFHLETRENATVAGALGGRLVVYTMREEDGDRIVGWQLSAEDDDHTRLFVDVDAPLADRANAEAQVKAMLDSIKIT